MQQDAELKKQMMEMQFMFDKAVKANGIRKIRLFEKEKL